MSFVGMLLMVSGWLLALAAVVLLAGPVQRIVFVAAGLLVEALGVGVIAWRYRSVQRTDAKGAR